MRIVAAPVCMFDRMLRPEALLRFPSLFGSRRSLVQQSCPFPPPAVISSNPTLAALALFKRSTRHPLWVVAPRLHVQTVPFVLFANFKDFM